MKQIPYLCANTEEFIYNINEFYKSLQAMPPYSCILADIYVDAQLREKVPQLIDALKALIPDIKIIGGTVSANITAGVINLYGISLTFSVFFKSTVDVIPIYWEDSQSTNLGKSFLNYVYTLDQPVAIRMISSGYNLNITPFLEEVSNIPNDIAFFGGVVDDGTVFGQGFVFSENEFIYRGMMVVVYKGRNLQTYLGNSSGWKPLGRKMNITELTDNNTTICTIDNVHIKDIYKKYLNIDWDNSFLDEAVIFPLSIIRNGTRLNRLPRYFFPNGTANYGADFLPNEKVQLCYGNPMLIIKDAMDIQQEMFRFQPEGIFAISCWARKLLLNRDVNRELDICRYCAPSTGIYALGEYVRDAYGKIYLNNMNLSILGMREGKPENTDIKMKKFPNNLGTQSKGNKVLSHMMHFVQAVSDDLERKNIKLQKIARMDALTNLFNRRELDYILEQKILSATETGKPLAIMVLDVDNFKTINDQLGHDVGDVLLKEFSNVIAKNSRRTDVVGRWGGDEFMIIMPDTDMATAKIIGEIIRSQVEYINLAKGKSFVSTSIGIAKARFGEDNKDTLFKRADMALYKAKHNLGKNSVAVIE